MSVQMSVQAEQTRAVQSSSSTTSIPASAISSTADSQEMQKLREELVKTKAHEKNLMMENAQLKFVLRMFENLLSEGVKNNARIVSVLKERNLAADDKYYLPTNSNTHPSRNS